MKPTTKTSEPRKPRARLFPFTEREEVRMIIAMEAALRFMQKYGKGRQPYMIDRDNYL